MGERRNDGAPSGRRHGRPEGVSRGRPGSGPHAVRGTEDIEALLVRALVREDVDHEAEQRAVAAFREARETGAHRTGALTRRRDDWRPRERRLGRFSVKATFSVLVVGLSLGGVAVAGIGADGPVTDGPGDEGNRSPTTAPTDTTAPADVPAPADTTAPAGAPASGSPSAGRSSGAGADSSPGSDPAAPERPARARDVEAHCRAYERVEGRGRALESVAWKRLVEAAGGAANIDAYCAERLRPTTGAAKPGGTGASGNGAGDSRGTPAQPGGGKNP
ncbi:hypothetical protein ACWEQO_05580 [Streptomyces sp. NPDC004051]